MQTDVDFIWSFPGNNFNDNWLMNSTAISFASYGIQENLHRFNAAASRIADPNAVAGIDEIVAMKQAEQGIKVNAAVIKTANEMSKYLIDILA